MYLMTRVSRVIDPSVHHLATCVNDAADAEMVARHLADWSSRKRALFRLFDVAAALDGLKRTELLTGA
ncbi:hypothetical protein GCM10022402_09260 [Salinactinospora qingdaonensis]|uniref:Transposase n=1 Tax=Salinactinospora qingdaonensis TaxID=702744 RepID=A0ABP7F3G1_9ACTN